MSFIDAHLWHHGPETLDWTLDLEQGTFGPLHLHSNIHDVKKLLGRPDDNKVFGKPHRARYDRFNLHIELEPDLSIWELEVETEAELQPAERRSFDPKVKLPGGKLVALRALDVAALESALGEPTRVEGALDTDHMREYDREGHTVYVDVNAAEQVTSVGFGVLEK